VKTLGRIAALGAFGALAFSVGARNGAKGTLVVLQRRAAQRAAMASAAAVARFDDLAE
jgi:hypothetical protein